MSAHPGGAKHCPFRNLSDVEARKKMKFVWEHLAKLSKRDWNRLKAQEADKE
jgi:hypothetical protein